VIRVIRRLVYMAGSTRAIWRSARPTAITPCVGVRAT
jgi:hypothetical protein